MAYKTQEKRRAWAAKNRDKTKRHRENWLAGEKGQAYLAKQLEKREQQKKSAPKRRKPTATSWYGKIKQQQYDKAYREEKRNLAIKKLGGMCAACGIDYPAVLQFDHIAPIGKYRSSDTYKDVLKTDNPENVFQLLCANCHVVKTRINGEYKSRFAYDQQGDDKKIEATQLTMF